MSTMSGIRHTNLLLPQKPLLAVDSTHPISPRSQMLGRTGMFHNLIRIITATDTTTREAVVPPIAPSPQQTLPRHQLQRSLPEERSPVRPESGTENTSSMIYIRQHRHLLITTRWSWRFFLMATILYESFHSHTNLEYLRT